MQFLRKLGLGVATSIFSCLLVVLAIALSVYVVLDKSATIKEALGASGVYQVLVDNTLSQKQQQLSAYLPIHNGEVQKAVREAFPVTYLQSTTDRNIDATYDWLQGRVAQPGYSANLAQPKAALAQNISQLVEQRLAGLPACTIRIATPTTVADILSLECRPVGIPTTYLVAAAQQGVEQSNVFDQVVAPVLTLQDEQGKSLTSSLSALPQAYRYFIIALYAVPGILVLCSVAILFWNDSRRRGVKVIARSLIVTGVITVLLSLTLVWALGKAAQWSAGSNNDLILIEGKIVEIAHLIGAQLRNWLVGIGASYVVSGVALIFVARIAGRKNAKQNMALNKSLGYNNNIPQAGTRFDPGANTLVSDSPETSLQSEPEYTKYPTSKRLRKPEVSNKSHS